MFEYLQQIDNSIYDRYLTLEKNIKSASNSFYDAYLDLQENFLKTILEKNSVPIAPHESCGALLKRPEVRELFIGKYGLDSYAYDKMGDYAKKANEHKHGKEKNVVVDTIVNYMRVFYDVSACCARAQGLFVPQFNGNFFKEIFGSTENISGNFAEVKDVLAALNEKVDKLAANQTRENQDAQARTSAPQNDNRILRNFIAKSEKKYIWYGTKAQFDKDKAILVYVQGFLIGIGLLSTIITSFCLKLYSTFSLFENIVLIQTIILLTYTLKS